MPLQPQPVSCPTPADAAAWRRALPAGPGAVAVVAGTFEILQPGNLAALREAAAADGRLFAAVEADGAAPSQAARGGPAYPLADRLGFLAGLRLPAALAPVGVPEADAFFHALAPYTWFGCPLAGDGPVAAAAFRHAAARRDLPYRSGCRTADIRAAAAAGHVPVELPPPFRGETAPEPAGPPPAATVNGCFDVLHPGHQRFLEQAAALAGGPVTLLVNSDASIRRYKGAGRPVFPFAFRRAALLALRSVAEVYPFEEDEPLALLARLRPALHVKGGSREPDRVRHEESLLASWGGRVAFCPLFDGYSTSAYLAEKRSPPTPCP